MKRHHTAHRLFWGAFFLGALLICMTPSASMAQISTEAVDDADFTTTDALLIKNLNALVGAKVCIILNSGTIFCGVVRKLSEGLVHLGHIQEREYNDLLIRISDISALGARFRAQPQQE